MAEGDRSRLSKKSVILIGAGGHARVIADIFPPDGEWELIGALSSRREDTSVGGLPVLGTEAKLPDLRREGVAHAFVAIGDNRARRDLAALIADAGMTLINVVSRQAIVSARARLGQGIAIMPGAVVNVDAEIADGVIVNTGTTVDHDCRIGAFAHLAPGTHLAGNVTVGEGALLGVGCQAIPGIKVGEWSIIGAGSVIVRDLPPHCQARGVPARVTGRK